LTEDFPTLCFHFSNFFRPSDSLVYIIMGLMTLSL